MTNIIQSLFRPSVKSEPEDKASSRMQLLATIYEMPEYKALSKSIALRLVFQKQYCQSVLDKLSEETLGGIPSIIKATEDVEVLLSRAIQAGIGYTLDEKDIPDFYSITSMKKLIQKLETDPDNKNYTNFQPHQIMQIFSKSTLKSAKAFFDSLPSDKVGNGFAPEQLLTEQMKGKLYCINAKEVQTIYEDYKKNVDSYTKVISHKKMCKKRQLLFKLSIVMLVMGASFIAYQFHLLSDIYTMSLGVIELFVAIIYLIWG